MADKETSSRANKLAPKTKSKFKLKPWMKWGVGIVGAAAALFGIAIVLKPEEKPKKKSVGLKVGPQCASYTITDPIKLRDALRRAVVADAKKGAPDPFATTAKFLKQRRFGCTVYPNNTRNPGEAKLYYEVFITLTKVMEEEGFLSAKQHEAMDQMAATWAASQGADMRATDGTDTETQEGAEDGRA